MSKIIIGGETYLDKVNGCWMGKNCGGTLGGPLEKPFGDEQPFDVWWYPKLEPGGIPNDDLEIQLVWLKALEEIGPSLTTADLAQVWINHIRYNWDEYGLHKTNLRYGLVPPVSGAHNNWFKDCMGCPIRSEIWACIAPGHPRLAARYAYEDAILDHAGGESVWGEFFNAAIEAAAFVESDPFKLLDIGLSYVPEATKTHSAVKAALDAKREGVEDWKEARRRVMQAAPHYNSQYSPINMGFQAVGWLWGSDFGDAICKAVNCGYDTDCTGATVGSYLGIVLGRSGMPTKWTEPLGETLKTNAHWGGLRNISDGPNPVPQDITELTRRTNAVAAKVLAHHGLLETDGRTVKYDGPASLYADDSIRQVARQSPMRANFRSPVVSIGVDYVDSPAVIPGQRKTIVTHVANPHPEPLKAVVTLRVPDGWKAPAAQTIEVRAKSEASAQWQIEVPSPRFVDDSNRLWADVNVAGRPTVPAAPVTLLGAYRFRVTGPLPFGEKSEREMFDAALPTEQARGDVLQPDGRPGAWTELWSTDNALPLAGFDRPGVYFVQTFVWSPDDRDIALGVPSTVPVKAWVNGKEAGAAFRHGRLRPNYDGGGEQLYVETKLGRGWNEILIKLVGSDIKPRAESHTESHTGAHPEAHLVLCGPGRELKYGQWELGRTRLPWELISGISA